MSDLEVNKDELQLFEEGGAQKLKKIDLMILDICREICEDRTLEWDPSYMVKIEYDIAMDIYDGKYNKEHYNEEKEND